MEDNAPDAQIRVTVHVHYHAIHFAFPTVKALAPVDVVGLAELRAITTAVIIHALRDVATIVRDHAPRIVLPSVAILVKPIVRAYALARARVRVKMVVPQHVQVYVVLLVPVRHLVIVTISQ